MALWLFGFLLINTEPLPRERRKRKIQRKYIIAKSETPPKPTADSWTLQVPLRFAVKIKGEFTY
jgi:hypothetical protein